MAVVARSVEGTATGGRRGQRRRGPPRSPPSDWRARSQSQSRLLLRTRPPEAQPEPTAEGVVAHDLDGVVEGRLGRRVGGWEEACRRADCRRGGRVGSSSCTVEVVVWVLMGQERPISVVSVCVALLRQRQPWRPWRPPPRRAFASGFGRATPRERACTPHPSAQLVERARLAGEPSRTRPRVI